MMIQKLMGEMSVIIPEQCTQRNEDVLFNCHVKAAPAEALLPSIRSLQFRWVNVSFFDHDLCADKNNIKITPQEGDRINGSHEPIVLSNKGDGALVIPFGLNDWKCVVFENRVKAPVVQPVLESKESEKKKAISLGADE